MTTAPTVAEMFGDAVESPSKTEVIIEQAKFKMLQGMWSMRTEFERTPDQASDFFLGLLLGTAMIAAKAEYDEQVRINSMCQYFAEEFAHLDDDGNLIDPPAD